MQILLPTLVRNCLHEFPKFLGILLSAEGCGVIFATVILKYLKIQNDKLIFYSLCLSAIGICFMGIFVNKFASLLLLIVCSFGITIVNIILNVGLLKMVPENYRSRFFTIIFFSEGIAAPFGLFTGGLLIDAMGTPSIFVLSGICLFILAVVSNHKMVFEFLNVNV